MKYKEQNMKARYMAALFVTTLSMQALAAENEFVITIENHKFTPAEITVPAGKKIKLRVENNDATPEEFESHELNREKIIPGNSKATIYIGPLEAGKYPFFGEFNEATAQGAIIAK
jgi:plastocyanin